MAVEFLRPKGVALLLLRKSFEELAESCGGPAISSEGSLLRYFADVYRALRLGVPKALKPQICEAQKTYSKTYLKYDLLKV